jgi:hypothetical protein
MRHQLAAVTATLCAGGCSFIYNPSNLDKNGDGGTHIIDAEHVADVNPAALTLTSVYPKLVYEGVGAGNSLPALVVVRGMDIASNATVTVTPVSGSATQITVLDTKIALNHEWIAISLSVPIDMTQDETGAKAATALGLTITVDNGGTMKSIDGSTEGGLKVQWLDQLSAPITAPPAEGKRFSKINISAANPFTASANLDMIHLRSESSITFGAGVTANATADAPGPGGCAGGGAQSNGAAKNHAGSMCSPGAGASGSGGAGGGHKSAGSDGTAGTFGGSPTQGGAVQGTDAILDVTHDVGGGGGGGGDGLTMAGGVGGGGGGTIFLDAAGDLMITGTVAANGAAGSNGASGGGGGAGGTIILKAGGTLSVTAATAMGALGSTSSPKGGSGGDGRIRFDAATGAIPAVSQGVMFKKAVFFSVDQTISAGDVIITGPAGATGLIGQGIDTLGNTPADEAFTFNLNGTGQAQPTPKLTAGYNKVCVAVPSGNFFTQSANCAEIAYLPHP